MICPSLSCLCFDKGWEDLRSRTVFPKTLLLRCWGLTIGYDHKLGQGNLAEQFSVYCLNGKEVVLLSH